MNKLLQETISSSFGIGDTSKKITSLMHKGNVNATIKLLTKNTQNGILPINKDNLNLLKKKKHSKAITARESVTLTDSPNEIHPILRNSTKLI